MKYKNILITGGAGKLGRVVYKHLEEQGYNVTLFDRFAPNEAVPPWDDECNTMFVKGELTDLGDCMRAITHAEADVIIHLAALPHDSDKTPKDRHLSWDKKSRMKSRCHDKAFRRCNK